MGKGPHTPTDPVRVQVADAPHRGKQVLPQFVPHLVLLALRPAATHSRVDCRLCPVRLPNRTTGRTTSPMVLLLVGSGAQAREENGSAAGHPTVHCI